MQGQEVGMGAGREAEGWGQAWVEAGCWEVAAVLKRAV